MAKTIAITGKGGTGKTTITALIIKRLKERDAGAVLAVDADPDSNLATVLGIPVEKTIGDLREESLKEIRQLPVGMDKQSYIEAGLHEIIVETEKVDFLIMGRTEGPSCYCYVNNLLREFSDKLHPSYSWIVMDNEAGLEHLSRRTAASIDHLIAVVNLNPLSIDCARRIDTLVTDLKNDVRHKHVLANGIPEDKEDALKARLEGLDMGYLGSIPHDDQIEECIFSGRSLFELDNSPAMTRIDEIMKRMEEGSGEGVTPPSTPS